MTALLPAPADAAVFAGAVFVLNATPGVDLLLTVSRTSQRGARAGVAAPIGIDAGCVVHALAAAFGLVALTARLGRWGARRPSRPALRRAVTALGGTLFIAPAARIAGLKPGVG